VVLGPIDAPYGGCSDSIHKRSVVPCFNLFDGISVDLIFLYLIFGDEHIPAASAILFVPITDINKFDVMRIHFISYKLFSIR
jgi:hypothetical protein